MKQVSFQCPECGLRCFAIDFEDDEQNTAVIHEEPPCQTYLELEDCGQAAEFMRESRMKYHPETFS